MSKRVLILLLFVCAIRFDVRGQRVVEEPVWLAPEIGPFAPNVHLTGTMGDSSGSPEDLVVGHHDPTREDGTVQGIELGLSLRLEKLQGFATYTIAYGADEEWERSWEEAFLKLVEIPGGLELRGGRMLGRFGVFNARHLHAWNFVDTPLVIGRFLGEDGLAYDGGDVAWLHVGLDTTYGLTVGYGDTLGHGGHDEDEGERGEVHGEEGLAFAGQAGSMRLFAQHRLNDFHSLESGFSMVLGEEEEARDVSVFGLDLTYAWRENGMEPGGRALTWTTEVLYRDVERGGEEAGHGAGEGEGDLHPHDELAGGSESGFYSEVVYTPHRVLDLGVRLGYLEGNDELATEERFQVSPAITTYLDPYRRISLRTQYNYDDIEGGGEEHTVWLQLGVSWGASEVR